MSAQEGQCKPNDIPAMSALSGWSDWQYKRWYFDGIFFFWTKPLTIKREQLPLTVIPNKKSETIIVKDNLFLGVLGHSGQRARGSPKSQRQS